MTVNMPQSVPTEAPTKDKVIRFTNCLIPQGNDLVQADLWVSPETGKILVGQDVFYNSKLKPNCVINLKGKILSPGFIETQINGAFGFDFSANANSASDYIKGTMKIRKNILRHGVTSFLPTITSQRSELYKNVSIQKPSTRAIHTDRWNLGSPFLETFWRHS
jgi:N-acetylglucosamine-6-phosphate deacetylase